MVNGRRPASFQLERSSGMVKETYRASFQLSETVQQILSDPLPAYALLTASL
jgi:hypothetical protein